MTANDPVNRPSHYTDGKIEVIDFIEDKQLGFHLGNAVKYISRAGKKDPAKEVEDLKKARWYLDRQIAALEPKSASSFLSRVGSWLLECFGQEIALDRTERAFRFTEESIELVQSLGISKEQVMTLVDYVFDRPVGETVQEVGGVMVTLAALCFAGEIDLDEAAEREYTQILEKIEQIRAKQFSKPKYIVSPIPGIYPNS